MKTGTVQLSRDGNNCTLSNGILTMYWKEDGTLGSLILKGKELVRNMPDYSDTDGKTAFYVDYHAEGAFHKMHPSHLDIYENDGSTAHIAYVDTTGYLALEYHIILKEGMSGYYSYIVAANNTDAPFELAEFRIVYRSGSRIFDHAANSERLGLQPTHKYMEEHEKLQDETFRLPDGEKYSNGDVYSKYDYASYFSRNPAWGQYGHGYGFFLIPVSTEYYPGGPQKQELLVHYDGIVLNYFTGSHFGTGNLHVPLNWQKFYGPFYQYFNEGEDGAVLYADACATALEEQKKWPYSWVNHPLYPLERSHVTGRLVFSEGTPCKDTTVVLGNDEAPFERQSKGYIYSAETDADGCFSLEHVRLGTYTLYAYQTGGSITEELVVHNIVIEKPEQTLPDICFKIPNRKLLWQLGTATRTAKGYRYAGELRNYKWMSMPPETLNFTIGSSKESEDWYYAQSRPGTWYLHFHLEQLPEHTCYLVTALAGACKQDMTNKENPLLTISLNGTELITKNLTNDSSVYRSATLSGRYRRLELPVEPSLLKAGENVIAFRTDSGMIMYDTILMQEEKE